MRLVRFYKEVYPIESVGKMLLLCEGARETEGGRGGRQKGRGGRGEFSLVGGPAMLLLDSLVAEKKTKLENVDSSSTKQ